MSARWPGSDEAGGAVRPGRVLPLRRGPGDAGGVRSRHPGTFVLHERDIESDDELLRRYLERIPVIEIDGVEAFELQVDETELELRLGIVQSR